MASAQQLELNSDPIQETAATLDVISDEGLLGSTGGQLPVKQGEVSLGRPQIYSVEPSADTTARLLPGPNGVAWRFYFVVFPFSLHPLPGGGTYDRVKLAVALDESDVTAFDLIPDKVVDEQEHKRTIKIGFKLPIKVGTAEAGMENQIVLKDLRPLITSFGAGESQFYWLFTNEKGVELGSRRVAAILQLPATVHSVTATITYDFTLTRRLLDFGNPVVVPARTEPWMATLALD